MTHYSRRASLRKSFGKILEARKSVVPARPVDRLKGRNGFRAVVRLIQEYIAWLQIQEPTEEEISDDVALNVRMARGQKVEKKPLSLQDRSILLIRPSERSKADEAYIYELLKKTRAFRKYSEDTRKSLASVCLYQYVPADRVIIRQGHPAANLYFIVDGEIGLSRVETDRYTGTSMEIDAGTMKAGDTFGEVALLHSLPRTATAVAKTAVELLAIRREDFNEILEPILTKDWAVLRDALVHFDYFKGWDENTIRECCILSRIKDFHPGEVILGDGKGMVNFVHFVLDGECRLIEHILLRVRSSGRNGTEKYQLFEPDGMISSSDPRRRRFTRNVTDAMHYNKDNDGGTEISEEQTTDYAQLLLTTNPSAMRADVDRMSITTTTLIDVINEWHAMTDIASVLLREPSITSQHQYPDDVKTVFMNVCSFYRGVCFGVGEEMRNRRIVAITPLRCLLVPRYWLLEHNRANIWARVKTCLNSKYPTRRELFDTYVNSQRWKKYKKQLVEDVCKRGRCISTNTTIHDVPLSTRVREGAAD